MILDFEDLISFRGFGGIVFRGPVSAYIHTPPDWILDGKRRNTNRTLAVLHPVGKTLRDSIRSHEILYLNIVLDFDTNFEPIPGRSFEKLLKFFKDHLFRKFKTLKHLKMSPFVPVDGHPAPMLTAELDTFFEHTVFLNYGLYTFYFILQTPKSADRLNRKNLAFILQRLVPFQVTKPGFPPHPLLLFQNPPGGTSPNTT